VSFRILKAEILTDWLLNDNACSLAVRFLPGVDGSCSDALSDTLALDRGRVGVLGGLCNAKQVSPCGGGGGSSSLGSLCFDFAAPEEARGFGFDRYDRTFFILGPCFPNNSPRLTEGVVVVATGIGIGIGGNVTTGPSL